MDQVEWKQERFEQIQNRLSPFLQNNCRFDVKKDVSWVPISGFYINFFFFLIKKLILGLFGQNIDKKVTKEICSWYNGLNLFETLEGLPLPERSTEGALRVPILDKFKNQGILNVFGKVESGILHSGNSLKINSKFNKFIIFNRYDSYPNAF